LLAAPSLRNIEIHSSPIMWSHFASPHATQVRFYASGTDTRDATPPKFDSAKWPALCILSIYGECLVNQDLQMPYIRELSLQIRNCSRRDIWLSMEETTRFCMELAMFPSHLRSLERLKLWGFPCWDIFLLMLKRRNITTSTEIAPIKYLTLGYSYPKELTKPLISLLQGKFPRRWFLHDVSIHNSLNLVCDQSM
ncbi:hypothetical protein CPB86DRAFT_855040, partial [Serendipita vermifera]